MTRPTADQMYEMLKDHYIEPVLDAPRFRAFYMRQRGHGRMQSALFMFTPEGIVICGDWTPGENNEPVGSGCAYGLDWFVGQLDGDYLCSKFLRKEWQNEVAVEWCRNQAEDIRAGRQDDRKCHKGLPDRREEYDEAKEDLDDFRRGAIASEQMAALERRAAQAEKLLKEKREEWATKYEELATRADDATYGPEWFYDAARTLDPNVAEDGLPGTDYPRRASALLCAFQRKFAELYAQLQKAAAK